MTQANIHYRAGYRYQLTAPFRVPVPELPFGSDIDTDYILLRIEKDGPWLRIRSGYAWDGPSGPTVDTSNFMRGSLVHDALYQLIREGQLPEDTRHAADQLLRRMCREDGMSAIRAWWVYRAVRLFGKTAADPANKKPILVAPA